MVMNENIITEEGFSQEPGRIAVTVSEFASMISMSERSAWTIVKQQAQIAERKGIPNPLPLVSPIEEGQAKRLRLNDVQRWLDGLS
jgi:hypothetical protein